MPKKFIYGGYVAWKKDEWRDIIGHDYVEDAEFTTDLILSYNCSRINGVRL